MTPLARGVLVRRCMSNPETVVQSFQRAMGAGDFAAARKVMRDDMKFQGPFDSFDRPEPYLEALKRLHQIVKSIKVHKTFASGDDVCVLYDMETNTPAGTAFIAEWFHVAGDRIASIRAVFDARPFAAMFHK